MGGGLLLLSYLRSLTYTYFNICNNKMCKTYKRDCVIVFNCGSNLEHTLKVINTEIELFPKGFTSFT